MAQLDGWNKLEFRDDEEYYELLGFLSQDNSVVKMRTEDNKQSGAGGAQTRFYLDRNVDQDGLPRVLKEAYQVGKDPFRLSETAYIRNLRENHHFDNATVSGVNDYMTIWKKSSLDDVLSTVPQQYRNAFNRGYHWNCEIVKAIRTRTIDDNFENETHQTVVEDSEGKKTGYYTTKYERSSANRNEAIRIHGTSCNICGFDYEAVYGELGAGYIEVHHIKPLSTLDEETVVNPETDLISVCANCHRMLHRFKNYIVSVEELKNIVEDNKDE
jgi:5-methylcytosine-specific restriction protein A